MKRYKLAWTSLALIVLAACGGTSTPSSTATEAPIVTVRMASVGLVTGFGPIFVAQQKGFFTKNRLDVQVTTIQAGAPLLAAIASNSIDLVPINMLQVLPALNSGVKAHIIGGVECPALNQILVRTGVNASSLADLKGMRLETQGPGAPSDTLMKYLLKVSGVDPKSATYVPVAGNIAALVAAFQGNQVDAGYSATPFTSVLVSQHLASPIIDLAKNPPRGFENYCGIGIWASDQFVSSNRDAAKRFAKAVSDAGAWMNDQANRSEAIQIVATATKADQALVTQDFNSVGARWATPITPANISTIVDITHTAGLIPDSVNFTYEQVVDTSIMPKK